jgi:hypothetical protein
LNGESIAGEKGKKESVGDRNLIFIEWQIELNGIDCWQQ